MKKTDDVDQEIVRLLKEDSSKPIRLIASQLKHPLTTIHARISRLKRLGIIKRFTIDTIEDQKEGVEALIFISTNDKEEVLKIDETCEAYQLTGEYEIMLKKRFQTLNDLNDFVTIISKDTKKTKTEIITRKIR